MTPEALSRIEEESAVRSGDLNLTDCGLTEVPEQLLHMPWFRHLSVSCNKIRTLTNLELLSRPPHTIHVSHNETAELENLDALSGLQSLTQIRQLNLSGNRITDIKGLHEIVSSPNLEVLYLHSIFNTDLKVPGKLSGLAESVNCLEPLRKYFKKLSDNFSR